MNAFLRGWVVLVALTMVACGNEGSIDGGDGGAGRGDGADDDSGSGGGDGGGNFCEVLNVAAARGIPNILILLDRSSSMSTNDRWGDATEAIKNVTANLEAGVAFGLMLYPGNNYCGPGNLEVAPATGTADSIANELDDSGPNGMTPTAVSLDAAGTALAGVEGDSYVLLVTDGGPNCNGDHPKPCTCTAAGQCGWGSGSDFCLDRDRSVERVGALATAGISTYVIGFDTSEWTAVLNDMAAAGDTERETYVPVSSGTELEETLAELAGNVVSCTFELETAPSDYRFVSVKLNGTAIPHTSETGNASGWELEGNQIKLLGASCELLKDTEDAALKIQVECEPVIL